MKIIFLLLLVIPNQNATDHESFSEIVQLHQYAQKKLNDLRMFVETVMENVAMQQKKMTGEMYKECSSYIQNALEKLEEQSNDEESFVDPIKNKIKECGEEVNSTIDAIISQYMHIFEECEEMFKVILNQLRKDPEEDDDLDKIEEKVDDIVDDFKETFEAVTIAAFEDFLKHIRSDVFSVPLNTKKCVDELLNLN